MIYEIWADRQDFSVNFINFWHEKTDGKLCDFEMKEPEDDGCPIPNPWYTWIVTFKNDDSVMDFVNFIHCHKEYIHKTMGGFKIVLTEW